MRKIGILGGTFNPPHMAHLNMARAAVTEGGMDEVIWIPNGDPPHKKPEISAGDRLMMTRLAVADEARMSVSDIEISRPGRSYMAETLELLSAEHPDDKLFLICGEDMLAGLASWYRAAKIFELADILAFRRENGSSEKNGSSGEASFEVIFEAGIDQTAAFLERHGARVHVMKTVLPDISSTALRAALAVTNGSGGRSEKIPELRTLIPETVLCYIIENRLYQGRQENHRVE